jgi:predicted metal-dependent phosphoesterase TrpH
MGDLAVPVVAMVSGMLIDLHAHTFPKSDDSMQRPEDLLARAKTAGLDGVCLTEHDVFWDKQLLARWSEEFGLAIFPGCEINTEWGHLLVLGLDRYEFGMHRAPLVRRRVDAAGGAIVLAHPYRRAYDPRFQITEEEYHQALAASANAEVLGLVDAVEGMNGRGTEAENRFALAVAHASGKAVVAGSDSHKLADVGRYATRFHRRVRNVEELAGELRAGRCEPVLLPTVAQQAVDTSRRGR